MFGVSTKAAAQVTVYHPFFIEFLYSFKYSETTAVPTAATDGTNLLVNPEWCASEPLDVQLFMLLHEIVHRMLKHPLRRGTRDQRLWIIACDYANNGLLAECGVAFDKTRWLYYKDFVGMAEERIYDALMSDAKIEEAVATGGNADLPGGLTMDDVDLDIQDPEYTEEEKQAESKAIDIQIARAVEMSKVGSGVPPPLQKFVADALRQPEEAWYNKLHRHMQSITYGKYSWARVNRRVLVTHGIMAPSLHSASIDHLVLLVDTSGSCFDSATQNNFCGHFNSIINEVAPRRTTVLYFDTRVRGVEEFQSGEVDVQLKPVGGGFTDFRQLFTYMEAEGLFPDVTIVLTDLEGPVPNDPGIPVLWAITSNEVAPFGDSIYIKG